MVQRITPTHAEQSSVFSDLIDEMQRQGAFIQPQLPDGQAVPTDLNNQQQQKPEEVTVKAQKPVQPQQVARMPQDQVTTTIANQGQLIPIMPQITASGTDDSIDELKKAVNWLTGKENANTGQPQQQSNGGDGGDIIGGIIDTALSIVGWIICTELVRQRRLPVRWYIVGAPVFAAYHPFVKEGYYLWAIPSVRHLRAYPDSFYSRFLNRVFNWRAENIAAHAGVKGAKKLLRGAMVTAILWPICFGLGALLYAFKLKQNWLSVYGVEQ